MGVFEGIKKLFFKSIKTLPQVKNKIKKDYAKIMKELEPKIKPYNETFPVHSKIPKSKISKKEILDLMNEIKNKEEINWKSGYASGAVYHGDQEHIDFMNQVYALNSQSNPLHTDLWPSSAKFESEIVSMTAKMLGAPENGYVCGTVTSGGSESILLAMKTYRDYARDKKGIKSPELIIPITAHAAFYKASEYFKINLVKIPVDRNMKADVLKFKKAINQNTIGMVGSTPGFPHGIIDPIQELSEIALEKNIPFHTDACLGGFLLPWAKRLGYPVPEFDFTLPGVSSISADTHKYGFAPKGTSVILYRDPEIRHYQYYKAADWPGGLYFSPTFAGSRPGALSAACWAAMLSMGEEGYLESTKKILETAAQIKKGIKLIPEINILGDPLWVIAFESKELDIYRIMDAMVSRGWSLNGLHKPSCIHLCVTLRHAQPECADRFLQDLKGSVAHVKANPNEKGGMAPVYGMAANLPDSAIVEDLLDQYMDLIYQVKK